MDVDGDGKASGEFLRARVAIEIDKPRRLGVLLRISKMEDPKWFEAKYERLPFYCFGCGIMGHSKVECLNLVPWNELGKLPYDIQLRAPEDRRRRIQSFSEAAADSFRSGSSIGTRPPQVSQAKGGSSRSARGDGESCHSSSSPVEADEDGEVQSPLKTPLDSDRREQEDARGLAGRKLDLAGADGTQHPARKRKSKQTRPALHTLDLNVPVGSNAIVPIELVNSRVSQLDTGADNNGGSLEETLKKQRRGSFSNNARSAAAAKDNPRRAQ